MNSQMIKSTALFALIASSFVAPLSQAAELIPRTVFGTNFVQGKADVITQMRPGETFSRTAAGSTATTYQIYVPTKFSPTRPGPILIAFHPGGNGRAMLDALKPSAEKAGWLLVGCDKLSNQLEDNANANLIEDELLADILGSLPYDSKAIYLAGFSGGAERCYHLTSRVKLPVTGILAYAGWLGGEEYQKKHYGHQMRVAMINGKNDSNANAWVTGDTFTLRKTGCRVKEFPWDGAHAIAPEAVTDQVIAWLEQQRKSP